MFHHIVFFYLKKDLTAAQRAEFETKLRGLLAIKSIHSGYVGADCKPYWDSVKIYDFE